MKVWQHVDHFNKMQICNIKIIAIYNIVLLRDAFHLLLINFDLLAFI
jgi:hypothetical protein